ncbi:MAG: fumarylacetoacetate hydrolase family protein [Chloroflexi bacterium]|nr:fumarylacetoacetate hydrolase family protein [Chloroflexota bacterium]MCH8284420.1 fumarylacetoacetate hydrolase family protein [Chloroflexota bacterium]MCI0768889.1 fumarylacetoacetate hydrolase family protein [Chloroflexota bacterium]
MKIARVEWRGQTTWVEVDGDSIFALVGDRFGGPRRGSALGPLAEARLLAPVEPANKVVGLLGNYGSKGERAGPGIFLKPSSAVIADGDEIKRPPAVASINFEPELGVVIGRRAKDVPVQSALEHVMGFTIVNDVTSFDARKEDGPASTRYKSYDTFCPMGPWIVTGIDASAVGIRSRLNGTVKQDSSTSGLAFNIGEAVAWVSSVMTLEPGDVISTGTPPGPGAMSPGDVIECEIDGIGVLTNRVVG